MLYWAVAFLVIALVAGILGLGGVEVLSVAIAKILFVAFLALFGASLLGHFARKAAYARKPHAR